MSDESSLDLGDVETARNLPRTPSRHGDTLPTTAAKRLRSSLGLAAERIDERLELTAVLSLVLPGSGRLVRGDVRVGLFFISWFGFLAALGWAVLDNLVPLTGTLELLDLPREGAVWVLIGVYVTAAVLYVANVLCAVPAGPAARRHTHPAVPGVASLILPGLGQVYNRDRGRAAMLLGGLWIAGAAWLLAWPETQSVLASIRIHLPPPVLVFCSPTVRWSLLVAIWTLGVYDAVFTAMSRNRSE